MAVVISVMVAWDSTGIRKDFPSESLESNCSGFPDDPGMDRVRVSLTQGVVGGRKECRHGEIISLFVLIGTSVFCMAKIFYFVTHPLSARCLFWVRAP